MASMRIACSSIPDGGLSLTFRGKDASWQGLAGMEICLPPSGHLTVRRKGREVTVEGQVRAQFGFTCSRCLEPFRYPVELSFQHLLRPREFAPFDAKEIELRVEDLEYGTYDGDTVDLGRVVEEYLILSLPMKPLCREECKGLCPCCGINRNEGSCRCHEAVRKRAFESLKDFMIQKG